MATGIEHLGEAATGGMIARAVEPESGEGGDAAAGDCRNCGTALAGPYCHRCGQKAQVHRTISAWWHDFLHGVLHLDGKLWRTLPMLAWRPGELTRRYVEGERARFISPLALFLFSVFLMFAVFSFTGNAVVGVPDRESAVRDITAERNELREQAAGLEDERRRQAARGAPTQALDARLSDVRTEIEQLDLAGSLAGQGTEGLNIETGWERLDKGARKAAANPALLFYKVQTNAYKFSWALIPISMPFLWLLFLHRGRYRRDHRGYDHLVFVTYSIAFMSLLLIAFVLIRSIGLAGDFVTLAFLLVPPVHIYRQLKQAYRLTRFGALWRTAALLVFASVALTLFLALLLGIGILG